MGDALRMFGKDIHHLAIWDIYKMYSTASTQPTLMLNPRIELASSSSENEDSLCQEDIQKLLGLQVWVFLRNKMSIFIFHFQSLIVFSESVATEGLNNGLNGLTFLF